jgi:hypothetical protein
MSASSMANRCILWLWAASLQPIFSGESEVPVLIARAAPIGSLHPVHGPGQQQGISIGPGPDMGIGG